MSTQLKKECQELKFAYPLTIESRFGDITIQESDVLNVPEGIYGFEDYRTYSIVPLPGQKANNLRVLQCLDEVGLVFLLTPLQQRDVLLIPRADLCESTNQLGLEFDDCDFYAITSLCEKDSGIEFSLNLKAPIVIHRASNRCWQYILQESEYPIKYVLDAAS